MSARVLCVVCFAAASAPIASCDQGSRAATTAPLDDSGAASDATLVGADGPANDAPDIVSTDAGTPDADSATDQDADSGPHWSREIGENEALAVVVDHDGNVIVNGSNAATAAVFQKFSPQGNLLLRKTVAGGDKQRAMSMAIDSANNIIVVGDTLSPTLDLGGGALGAGSFVAKFSPTGTHLWSKPVVPQSGSPGPLYVAVTPSDQILIAGAFAGTAAIAGGQTLTSAGVNDRQDPRRFARRRLSAPR